jgi:leucyl aminopeptidase
MYTPRIDRQRPGEVPHDDDYAEFIKTTPADIKNIVGRPAETITAGLFVGHFAGSVPWAHLDIAGMAFGASKGA